MFKYITMWLLILIAVNINDPKNQPGRVELTLPDQKSCESVLNSMTYTLRYTHTIKSKALAKRNKSDTSIGCHWNRNQYLSYKYPYREYQNETV